MRRSIQRSGFRSSIAVVVVAISVAAHGVVIDTGNGTGNTTAPVDDFGFESVGQAGGFSAVHLGAGWILTADHVGERAVVFLGNTHQPVVGSGTQLTNTSGDAPDLFVFRVYGFPALPTLTLASVAPAIGEDITCSGSGGNRLATTTKWNAAWVEVTMGPYSYEGYKRGSGGARRWGRNVISDIAEDVTLTSGKTRTTRSLRTTFDDQGGVTDESQAWLGDSGGGCFVKRNGTWELVGILYAQGTFLGQPDLTAVYGNTSLIADVFFYKDQIEALTPQPVALPALSHWGTAALTVLLAGVTRFAHRRRSA